MPPETTILAFDTSAAQCAAALLSGDRIIVAQVEDMAKGQAERLIPLLEEVLAEAGLRWADLDAIGVGIGPGNFTGIRISVSAARGLALALGKPAIGVSTFEALAEGTDGAILASVAARADITYLQLLDTPVTSDPVMIEHTSVPRAMRRSDVTCIGHAARDIAREIGANHAAPRFGMIEGIARTAARKLASGQPQPRPAPLYVRAANAAPPRDPAVVILP
ncbi:MAG: tRNA (adenosine(37)-N6)-threonylcarbamoyltransferase complex dimerization subunit type 1 TsaB [Paracoccaceae bacterium]